MEIGNFGFSSSGGGGGGTPIVGGGTLNYICKFTPDGTTIGNSLLYDDGTSVGIGTNTPDASAILDLNSTTQGFAAPRMTTLQRDAIVAPVVSLLIFNTSSGFYNYWDGSAWIQMDTSTGGDVSGSGTTNYATMWTDGANSVIGDGTWYFSGNDYLPVTTGVNIGDATHRIGTIFMASVFDYTNDLSFYNGTSTTMTLTTGGNLGIGTTTPDASAILDLTSTSQGFVTPRMTTLEKNAITSPATSLLLFDTDENLFSYWDGSAWTNLNNGGIFGANNGLSISGTDVQLGGSLIQPTTISSSGVNTFSVTDDVGIMLKTRDSNANFILNAIYGTPTFTTSSLIFAFTSDGGTSFTNSNIVYHFGGANSFTGTIDTFSFGDYHTFDTVFQTFNFGRGNTFTSVSNTHLFGDYNILNSCSSVNVFGNNNTINAQSNKFYIGNNNNNLVVDGSNGYVGIGTASPSYYLDIQGTTQASIRTLVTAAAAVNTSYFESDTGNVIMNLNAFVTSVGTSGGSRINFNHTGSTIGSIYTNTANSRFWIESSYDIQLYNNATLQSVYLGSGGIYFNTTSTTRMFVSDAGNVGIGTTSVSARTHIQGVDSTSANYALKVDNSASSPLLYVRNDGNVGIGIIPTIADAKLEIKVATNQRLLFRHYNYVTIGDTLTLQGVNDLLTDVVNVVTLGLDWYHASRNNLFADGNALFTPSAKVHIVGNNQGSDLFALKVDNLGLNPLLYVRNDGVDAAYFNATGKIYMGTSTIGKSGSSNGINISAIGQANWTFGFNNGELVASGTFDGGKSVDITSTSTSNFQRLEVTGSKYWDYGVIADDFKIRGILNTDPSTTDILTIIQSGATAGYSGFGIVSPLAKVHIFGGTINQRLEPVANVTEDTGGNTINTTTNATVALETIAIPTNTVLMIESYITCRKTGGAGAGTTGGGNGYIRTVKAKNVGGVVTIGVVQSSFTSEDITPLDATFAVSGTNVLLNVTGANNDNITWNSITKKYKVA